jgi:proteasome activator-like protein
MCQIRGMTDAAPPTEETEPAVSDPAKLIRLGTMLQALMAEVRSADTDEESRRLLARIHNETMEELGTVLSSDLMEELSEFTNCCDDDGVPTEAEIRVAQAQLVGWLQGLLQGLQASVMTQQAAAARQFQQLAANRRPGPSADASSHGGDLPRQSGTYL